jgi:cation-transporting P-type ATPase C
LSVVWLINLGRLLEVITLKRSRTAIKDLMGTTPNEAWLVAPGKVRKVAVEKISKQETIRVFQGEKVPLDGKIIRGTGALQEAFITGEAIPREKLEGETVYAGSVLAAGEIDVQVTSLVSDTVVARMVDIIENLRDRKAPIERIGNRFASKFVPISIGASVLTLMMAGDLRRAITMLVIACPCAAGLATPTAVSAAIGQAARKGILIKGGTYVEMAARVDTLIFDKTGTLTEGTPRFQRFIRLGDVRLSDEDILRLAASAEQHSTHPLGAALVAESKRRGIALAQVQSFKQLPGLGIDSVVEQKRICIGNRRYFTSLGFDLPPAESAEGASLETLLFFAMEDKTLGTLVVLDPIRAEAHAALAKLAALGIKRIVLASGDRPDVAAHVAHLLGITEVHAEMMPEDKLTLVRDLRASGRRVAMVGDGINDAQALAEADLSIAMGGGHCDIAIETADVTLGRNDLMLVPEVIDISRRTLRTIYENFIASVGINAGGVVFGAVGKLSPFSAAIVHNAATIAVVLNSLKLGRQVAGSNPLTLLGEVKI